MLASELIKKLQELQEQFGDLEVKIDTHCSVEAKGIDILFLDADIEEIEYWFSVAYKGI